MLSFNSYKQSFYNIKTCTLISTASKQRYEIVGCKSFFNKELSLKGVHPLVAFIARQAK